MKTSRFTNKEMMSMKEGTKVRIRKLAKCNIEYKKGGELVFQTEREMDDDERQFGILVKGFGVCFTFSCFDYVLIQ